MFVKITGSKNRQYLQIVHSYRSQGKVKHKVLFNFGRVDLLKNSFTMKRLVRRLNEILNTGMIEPEKIEDAEVFNWGWRVYKNLWDRYGLGEILNKIKPEKASYDFVGSCFLMAVEHLLAPRSKRSMYIHQGRYLGLSEIELNHLYRSLDVLSENKEGIELELFNRSKDLFNSKVDVVFYDCTTFYFESEKRDGLRGFGYSKEGKINHVQVVFGLLIDMEGRPVGYEIFSGNTFEGKTLEIMLDKLSKKFGIRKVVIVADKGLMSKINIEAIKSRGYGYIIASRIKSLPEKMKEEILKEEGYIRVNEDIRYKEIEQSEESRLIVFHSNEREAKDRAERQRLIQKAEELLSKPSLITASIKRGGRKYIKPDKALGFEIDNEAIREDEAFDGYFGIQTSEKGLTGTDILTSYHELWRIEESFRCMKSNLEVRPIFHWTERRIRGHFVMCFIAFLLERALEIEIKRAQESISLSKIREAINNMNYVKIEVDGQKIYIKTKLTEEGRKILRVIGMKVPENVVKEEKISLIKI